MTTQAQSASKRPRELTIYRDSSGTIQEKTDLDTLEMNIGDKVHFREVLPAAPCANTATHREKAYLKFPPGSVCGHVNIAATQREAYELGLKDRDEEVRRLEHQHDNDMTHGLGELGEQVAFLINENKQLKKEIELWKFEFCEAVPSDIYQAAHDTISKHFAIKTK